MIIWIQTGDGGYYHDTSRYNQDWPDPNPPRKCVLEKEFDPTMFEIPEHLQETHV